MEYHKTRNLLYVKKLLGHKNLENTHLYIQLENSLFRNLPNDMFITRIAKNAKDACSFIEVGFEYVTGDYGDGAKSSENENKVFNMNVTKSLKWPKSQKRPSMWPR
jgi:hypothetical protein